MTWAAEAATARSAGRALDIRLLGPITAERDGEAVSLGGPRQRAVLARLALVLGHVVTVDRLVDDVWAGDPPATAVNTLQSYVSLLRRALGDAQALRREGPGYVLAVARDVLDAARFEDGFTAARTFGPTPEALELLDGALGEWRGPVIADVADEEWARSAAVRWEELRLSALEARFEVLLAMGRSAEAVAELERALDEHPLREGFARQLMIALYRSDRQADALRAFSRTRAVLTDELGLDPSPALVALQTAILNHDPELTRLPATAKPTPAAADQSVATKAPAPTAAPSEPPPASPVALPGPAARAATTAFVGRQRQLAQLHRRWDDVTNGDRHLALLVGEAGAGKSRLAAQFAAEAHERGAIVLWGRATPEAIVPFEPMVEALRTALRTISPEAGQRVAADRGILSLLLPELDHLVPGVRLDRPEPTVERYLLFEAVAEVLHAESAQHPMLIVLDDVHWADAPSLKMIEHIFCHELTSRVMVVATARSPADEPTPELDRIAAALSRLGHMTRVVVGGLGTDEVGELLALNGREDADAADLRAATAGNAFFLTELIHHTEGKLADDLPESVRAMLGVRLDRLDPAVTQVLNLAAVAGQAATLPVLVAASGLDGERVIDATDHAVAAGLLVEDGAGRLGMPHALIGQAVRERLGRTRRLDLHRRLGEALEEDNEPNASPSRRAHHLMEAGALIERRRRVSAGLAAGQHSVHIGAFEDAASWAARTRELITEQIDLRDRLDLALLECDTARAVGDRPRAIDAARAAADLARRSGEPFLLARAAESWMMSLSGVGFDIGRPVERELVSLMELSIATLPPEELRYGVRLRSMLTSVLVPSADATRREALAAEALAIAASGDDPELVASAHLAQRLALAEVHQLHERSEAGFVAVREAERTANPQLELTAMLFTLTDLMELGRVDEHLELLARFRTRAADLHLTLFEVYGSFMQAARLLSTGRYAEAQQEADAALERGVRSHGVNAQITYAGIRYRIELDQGRIAGTVDESERMIASNPRLRMWQVALVRSLIEVGRRDDAVALLAELVGADGVALRDNQMFLLHTSVLTEAAEALGDEERCAVLQEALEPYAGRVAVSGLAGMTIGPVSAYVGLAALGARDLEAAERYLRQGIAENVAHGTRPHEARARRDLARLLRRRGDAGDDDEAVKQDAEARRIDDDIGLVL
ncbi:MAG: BTAD domain-containing putative transcriptional regulator [Ilumatobacteraceae bacterium]